MKKVNFISLVLSVIGLLLFGLGMCMCMLPQWNSFKAGLISGLLGIAVLIIMIVIRRKMLGKAPVKINKRTVLISSYSIISLLVLGTGMSMVMIWQNLMVPGMILGIAGIIMLLFLIPLFKGIK